MATATATLTETIRNAELDELVDRLQQQREHRADYIVPAAALRAENGLIHVTGEDLVLNPTPVMIQTMADSVRLDLPNRHLHEFHTGTDDPDVSLAYLSAFDTMINARLAKARAANTQYMVRTFAAGENDGGIGTGRALLSNRYQIMDNLDQLLATIAGINESGVDVKVQSCDLTETRMRVKFYAPAVQYMAEEFLKGYRNPFGHGPGAHSGYDQGEEPVIFAGFEISNKETGGGALTIMPRFVIQICKNGMRIVKDVIREIHSGRRLDHGQINFADDTHKANLELVTKMTRDAVARFLDPEFLETRIRELEALAAVPVPAGDATDVVKKVAKTQQFTKAEADDILGMFIAGGQLTAGGVMQAVTAASQTIGDPERAAFLEERAVPVLHETVALVAA